MSDGIGMAMAVESLGQTIMNLRGQLDKVTQEREALKRENAQLQGKLAAAKGGNDDSPKESSGEHHSDGSQHSGRAEKVTSIGGKSGPPREDTKR